jgi:hypothetical protein
MDRTIRERSLEYSLGRLNSDEKITEESVETFANTGKIVLHNAMPYPQLVVVRGAAERLLDKKLLPLTRPIKDSSWHNVEKVTLFRDPNGLKQLSHSARLLAPELLTYAEWSDKLVRKLGRGLIGYGKLDAGFILTAFKGNRLPILRMLGHDSDTAVIGQHRDVHDEKGANVSLALDKGLETVANEVIPANTLTVYACFDTCEALGIEQALHGYSAETERLSLLSSCFITE